MSKIINDIIDGIEKLFNIYDRIKNNFYKVDLNNLTKTERKIINQFYNSDLKEYSSSSIIIPETKKLIPYIKKLNERNILKKESNIEKFISYDGYGVEYQLTSKALKKLNKQRKVKK